MTRSRQGFAVEARRVGGALDRDEPRRPSSAGQASGPGDRGRRDRPSCPTTTIGGALGAEHGGRRPGHRRDRPVGAGEAEADVRGAEDRGLPGRRGPAALGTSTPSSVGTVGARDREERGPLRRVGRRPTRAGRSRRSSREQLGRVALAPAVASAWARIAVAARAGVERRRERDVELRRPEHPAVVAVCIGFPSTLRPQRVERGRGIAARDGTRSSMRCAQSARNASSDASNPFACCIDTSSIGDRRVDRAVEHAARGPCPGTPARTSAPR